MADQGSHPHADAAAHRRQGRRRGRRRAPCRPSSTTWASKYPGITQRLFDNGQVRRFVNVYLNDEDIRYLDNLGTRRSRTATS